MRKPAEKEVKNLLRKMRLVCDELGDCPVKKARNPTQLDCFTCILQDVEVMREELGKLREFKKQITLYGTSTTKLEVALDTSGKLIKQIRGEMVQKEIAGMT